MELVTDHLISRIKDLYQHSLLSNMEIAKKIADQDGLHCKEEALILPSINAPLHRIRGNDAISFTQRSRGQAVKRVHHVFA